MTNDSEEPEVSEAPPVAKPRISVVIMLSMLLGVMLTVGVAGMLLHLRKSNALEKEMIAAREDLKEKSIALEEMKAQIEALSKQMNVLKEYSIARSSSPGEKNKKAESPVPAADAKAITPPAADAKEGAVVPDVPVVPALPKVPKKNVKPEGQSCELVGKSPEEQTATLKRCVGMMDMPKEKAGAR